MAAAELEVLGEEAYAKEGHRWAFGGGVSFICSHKAKSAAKRRSVDSELPPGIRQKKSTSVTDLSFHPKNVEDVDLWMSEWHSKVIPQCCWHLVSQKRSEKCGKEVKVKSEVAKRGGVKC